MRPKFVFGILLVATFAMALAFVWKGNFTSAPRTAAPIAVAPAPTASANDFPAPAPIPVEPPPIPTPEEQQAANDAEIDRLQDWSRSNDPQLLSNILADLASPQKDVREAAIEAAKQFGSTNAIPALKEAAMNATDTDEQIELLQAANFLSLPSIEINPPASDQ